MRKAGKLFQLTNLIRVRQPITADEIALSLNVSVRTVYRYIDDLSVSGIPIYGTPGVGYQLDEDFELPPLNVTAKELDALLLGVKMVTVWTGEDLSNAANSLVKKIEAVIPKSIIDEYADVVFTPDFNNKIKTRKSWEVLHNSIKSKHGVTIEYQSLDGTMTSRTIYPLGLLYWGGKWTLASWCKTREDFRNFRVDRIINLNVCESQFETTDKINLQSFMASYKK